jgi:pyruvate dehydrogenase E2 component (dihydrolipoamide acetyltransferase)
MATEFLMPKLGLTMEEGTITEWLVADGEQVAAGAAVLRIETDKTETDVEAPTSGRVHPLGQVGDTYACGEQIGWFLAEGEAAPAGSAASPTAAPTPATATATVAAAPPSAAIVAASTAPGGRLRASPNARRLAAERGLDLTSIRGTGPGGRIVSEDLDGAIAAPAPARRVGRPSVPATAAARQLADLVGVELASVEPDPLDGRVTKEAVARHVRTILAAAASTTGTAPAVSPAPAAPTAPALQQPTEVIRLAGMRGTIAKRMHESLATMAQLTLFMDADLGAVVDDRTARKADGPAPGFTDYVIAAAARALLEHPLVNSQITDDGVALLPQVHVGMAVALDGGLIVPVIRDTPNRDLSSLAAESSRLATAARDGALGLSEIEGGTFSVSTLGMFDVDGFTPVINPPNTAILGVGRLRDEVVLSDEGAVSKVTRLTLSLTWDHRAFDGAPAAAFCRSIVELLRDPSALDTPRSETT